MPVTLAGPGSEVFRDRVTLPSKTREGPSPEVRLPSRVLPGCTARTALAALPPALAGARVRLSWGSPSLRRDHSGCPVLPRSVTRPREAKGASPSPGSALGVLPPLGGFSRDGVRRARVAPLPPLRHRYAPELRGLVSCRERPWDSPFRAFPSRGAAPPLGGRCFLAGSEPTATSGAKTPRLSDRFRPRASPEPCAEPSVKRTTVRDHRRGTWLPRDRETACPPRELPRTTTSATDTGDLRARRHSAVPRSTEMRFDLELPSWCRTFVIFS